LSQTYGVAGDKRGGKQAKSEGRAGQTELPVQIEAVSSLVCISSYMYDDAMQQSGWLSTG